MRDANLCISGRLRVLLLLSRILRRIGESYFLWLIAFFGLKSPPAGFIIITPLWIAIAVTIIHFKKISKTAATLLIPYILWVSFTTILNLAIQILNP